MRHAVLNFIRVAANIISHYFHTAAPCWTAICLAAVILIVRFARIKKKEKKSRTAATVRTELVSECTSAYFLEQHSGTMLQ